MHKNTEMSPSRHDPHNHNALTENALILTLLRFSREVVFPPPFPHQNSYVLFGSIFMH